MLEVDAQRKWPHPQVAHRDADEIVRKIVVAILQERGHQRALAAAGGRREQKRRIVPRDRGCMKEREPLEIRMKRFEHKLVNRSDRLLARTSEASRLGVEADDRVRGRPGYADRT